MQLQVLADFQKPVLVEGAVFGPGYAGTLDIIILYRGIQTLCDWKTSLKRKVINKLILYFLNFYLWLYIGVNIINMLYFIPQYAIIYLCVRSLLILLL
jgi:hypothetical protein